VGVLAPAGLLLGLAVAVPILLHFLHRTQRERVAFPALQYLLRMEKDHARQIRMRQWLLLALRVALLVLIALAAARAVVRGGGTAHPPTAVVVVLDNSMSSGRVVGTGRVLDTLKARASESLAAAGAGDRFWVLRAGAPWETVAPLRPEAALRRIEETEAVDTHADLVAAVGRARAILDRADAPRGEVHLLSDLQATAFPTRSRDSESAIPTVVWTGSVATEANGYVRDAVVGGGLAPREGSRTDVAVSLGGSPDEAEERGVRMLAEGRLLAAVRTRPGGSVVLPAGPFDAGVVEAEVETDPDALRADDRFHLRIEVVPPPRVARQGDLGEFLASALDLLEGEGRIRPGTPATADVVVAGGGVVPDAGPPGQSLVVVAPSDPARRPALARRFADLGVDLDIGPERVGESAIGEDATGSGLEGVIVRRTGPINLGGPGRRWVTLEDGNAWLVSAPLARGGEVTLVGSPLDPSATDVPVTAGMIPLVEWLVGRGGTAATGGGRAGDTLRLPSRATEVVSPAGTRLPVDGTSEFRATDRIGVWTVLAGDSLLERIALNAPTAESLLEPLDPDLLPSRLGGPVVDAGTRGRWSARIFTERQGREVGGILLVLALLLLALESWVAASGGSGTPSTSTSEVRPRAHDA
jgi:hypothetical protein